MVVVFIYTKGEDMISLNMIFWTAIITLFYLIILVGCIKEIKNKNVSSQGKGAIGIITFFYLLLLISMWVVIPEDWF